MLTHLGILSSSVPSLFESLHLSQDTATADPNYSLLIRRDRRGALVLAECLMGLSGHFFEGMKATYQHLVLLSALLRWRNTYSWCLLWRPVRVRTLKLGAPPLRVHDGPLSSTWYRWRGCWPHQNQRKPSSVFITLAEAITLWHPVRTDCNVLFERACLLNQFAENTASLC